MKTKTVGKRKSPKTAAEFHAQGAKLDLEASVVGPFRKRGFVLKARTWEELERWEKDRSLEQARQMRAQ
jgi:hypothetical protein